MEDRPYHFEDKADYIASLTQRHGHLSTWDENNMTKVLSKIGFVDINRENHTNGRNMDLLVDDTTKSSESLILEGTKPE